MENATSTKPVRKGFDIKSLILSKMRKGKARPVENQLPTSNEQTEPSDLEVFRQFSPKEPPMIAPGMPDYDQFCTGYTARSCEHCPHYVNSGTGLFCQMWEEVYPGRVTWYPID